MAETIGEHIERSLAAQREKMETALKKSPPAQAAAVDELEAELVRLMALLNGE